MQDRAQWSPKIRNGLVLRPAYHAAIQSPAASRVALAMACEHGVVQSHVIVASATVASATVARVFFTPQTCYIWLVSTYLTIQPFT